MANETRALDPNGRPAAAGVDSATGETRSLRTGPNKGVLVEQVGAATAIFDLSATSPAAAGAAAQAAVTGLGAYRSLFLYASLLGATGGTLDVYLQVSPDGGTTWVDYAHWPQLAAGAAATQRAWTVAKAQGQSTLQTVGTGTAPGLAVNTIVGGDWGDRLRVLFVAGAGTTAGALQTIRIIASS